MAVTEMLFRRNQREEEETKKEGKEQFERELKWNKTELNLSLGSNCVFDAHHTHVYSRLHEQIFTFLEGHHILIRL